MSKHYILQNKKVVEVDRCMWEAYFNTDNRHVAYEKINGWIVSTVFLGIDHNFSKEGEPLLFETMIFNENKKLGDRFLDYQERCSTWEQAEKMHKEAVKYIRERTTLGKRILRFMGILEELR